MENMFPISFRKFCDERAKQLGNVYIDHENLNPLYLTHHYVNSSCLFYASIELLSYINKILNQSVHVLMRNILQLIN